MKHCPECNFSFPDFYRVCDFDGTELVPDPERLALIKVPIKAPPRPSRLRRSLKAPMLFTSLAILVLFLSAVLIAHFESATESVPVVKEQPSPNSPGIANSVAQASNQSPAEIKTPATSTGSNITNSDTSPGSSAASVRRPATTARTLVRVHQRNSVGSRSQKSEVARRTNAQRISNEKQPKLVAVLKTTWRVLTKPFKF